MNGERITPDTFEEEAERAITILGKGDGIAYRVRGYSTLNAVVVDLQLAIELVFQSMREASAKRIMPPPVGGVILPFPPKGGKTQ